MPMFKIVKYGYVILMHTAGHADPRTIKLYDRRAAMLIENPGLPLPASAPGVRLFIDTPDSVSSMDTPRAAHRANQTT